MRVYDVNLTSTSAAESGRAQESQKAGSAGHSRTSGSGTAGNGDRVEFSSALGRLSQALSAFSSDRASRVQALASQYQSGQYRLDSRATGRAMVTEMLAATDK
jgi:anti-sigma28 factor (negative regulator of flagellin synthesis)